MIYYILQFIKNMFTPTFIGRKERKMMAPEEITLKQSIVHILDSTMTIPVLSMDEMPSSIETNDFFIQHITKVMNDDALKECVFHEDHNLFLQSLTSYLQKDTDFVTFSKQVAGLLFNIISSNVTIPSGDFVVTRYSINKKEYLALMKLNYQNTYIHFTDYESEVNINTVIMHRTTLPNIGQRVTEACIIDTETLGVKVLDRSFEINGEKKPYIATLFLKCETKLSSKENMQIIKSATNKVAKKFFEEDHDKKASVTKALFENLEENGDINLKNFANDAFTTNEVIKEEFFETIEKKGIIEPVITLAEKTQKRNFEKHRLKTDTGIEIKIPLEIYNDPTKMEFVTESNGKISILIKDVKNIT